MCEIMGILSLFIGKSSKFFLGGSIPEGMLEDRKNYKKGICLMWCVAGFPFVILGIFSIFFDSLLITLFSAVAAVMDVFFLIFTNHLISKKYFSKR